ncbi:unnamed protein product, partial [marine sediment metagenome]
FKATVTSKEDLYQVDREVEGTPPVTLLEIVQAAGTKASLYGSVEAHRIMDQWTLQSPQIQVGFEQFGSPRGAFGPKSYVRGSNEAKAALRQQAVNAEIEAQARRAALEQKERERIAREEQEERERIARQEREEKERIALEAQLKKEEEQREMEREAAYEKLILATVPGTRYIGTIARDDEVHRICLVFTEQTSFMISAEVTCLDRPEEKQTFRGQLISDLQLEKGTNAPYPIVMNPTGGSDWAIT